ncbi:alpha/beta fold hydrolase [Cupriavidus campinensis]|uniref:Alpha/beta hydrolase n=1 Tax=Cupriavidus campinensis TaxID=151783 RepID=A0AAE9I7I9_9BURK|nr:alpha/beta hydrolase [Cupriavidus campinensis]URF07760.1 alpha/beta hydrolase [Cupriavidus campinensis]
MSPWIFLRGLTRESRHWGDLPALWTARGLGRPTLIDLPGNGTAHHATVPVDVHGIMEAVRATARATGVTAPYRILAMSLGAMVATEWAQRYPGEVAGLVLINTSMRPFSTLPQRLRPQNWAALIGMANHWHDRARCERTVHRLTCERMDTRDADLATWVDIGQTAPVSRAAALRQLLAAARYRAAPSAPPCPTLILSSDADRLVNPVCSVRIAAAWGARHLRHPWAGHDLPHDDGGWLCGVVAGSGLASGDATA